jgi:hypothetical protein
MLSFSFSQEREKEEEKEEESGLVVESDKNNDFSIYNLFLWTTLLLLLFLLLFITFSFPRPSFRKPIVSAVWLDYEKVNPDMKKNIVHKLEYDLNIKLHFDSNSPPTKAPTTSTTNNTPSVRFIIANIADKISRYNWHDLQYKKLTSRYPNSILVVILVTHSITTKQEKPIEYYDNIEGEKRSHNITLVEMWYQSGKNPEFTNQTNFCKLLDIVRKIG